MRRNQIKIEIIARTVERNEDMSVEFLSWLFQMNSIPFLIFKLKEELSKEDFYKMLNNDEIFYGGTQLIGDEVKKERSYVKRMEIKNWDRTEYWEDGELLDMDFRHVREGF